MLGIGKIEKKEVPTLKKERASILKEVSPTDCQTDLNGPLKS